MSQVLVRYVQYFFNVKDIHWLKGILTIKIKLPWSYIFCKFFKGGNKYTVEALLTITYCHLHKTSVFSTPISTNSVFLHSRKVSDKHQLWTQPFSLPKVSAHKSFHSLSYILLTLTFLIDFPNPRHVFCCLPDAGSSTLNTSVARRSDDAKY